MIDDGLVYVSCTPTLELEELSESSYEYELRPISRGTSVGTSAIVLAVLKARFRFDIPFPHVAPNPKNRERSPASRLCGTPTGSLHFTSVRLDLDKQDSLLRSQWRRSEA